MILVFIETNFWIWCGYLTLRKTLSSKKKISGFYVCQLIYLVKTSSNLSLSRHTSWWICPISLDLEVPMELHHYNQCNYIPLRDIVEYAACQDYVWNIFSAIIQPFQQAMSASFNTPKCKLSSYSGRRESFFKFLLGMIQHLLKV